MVILPGIGLVAILVRSILRMSTKVDISRASLASLDRQQAELPKATASVHTKPSDGSKS